MKYLKLFENFEENKIPKSITVKITDEGIKRLGLKDNVAGKVTLYPRANQWLGIGNTIPNRTYSFLRNYNDTVVFYYAKWLPDIEEIQIMSILTNPPHLPEKDYGKGRFFKLPTMSGDEIINHKNTNGQYEISYWFDKLDKDETRRIAISDIYVEKILEVASGKGELGFGATIYCKFDKPDNYKVGETDHREYFEIVSLQ